MKRSLALFTLAFIPAMFLAGCGSPSENDVREAIYTSEMKPINALAGNPNAPKSADDESALKLIHLVSCNKVDSVTFGCQVTGYMSQTSVSSLKVVKTDNGWVLNND